MNSIKILDPNKIKIDKTPQKDILIYYIGYVTVKDLGYVKVNSINRIIIYF